VIEFGGVVGDVFGDEAVDARPGALTYLRDYQMRRLGYSGTGAKQGGTLAAARCSMPLTVVFVQSSRHLSPKVQPLHLPHFGSLTVALLPLVLVITQKVHLHFILSDLPPSHYRILSPVA